MKKIISIALALVLLLSLSLTAGAESLKGKDGLKVTFTAAEKLEPNFTAAEAFGEKIRRAADGIIVHGRTEGLRRAPDSRRLKVRVRKGDQNGFPHGFLLTPDSSRPQ